MPCCLAISHWTWGETAPPKWVWSSINLTRLLVCGKTSRVGRFARNLLTSGQCSRDGRLPPAGVLNELALHDQIEHRSQVVVVHVDQVIVRDATNPDLFDSGVLKLVLSHVTVVAAIAAVAIAATMDLLMKKRL